MDMSKVKMIYDQGAENIRVIKSRAELENIVLKSPDPWFVLFCTNKNPMKLETCNHALL